MTKKMQALLTDIKNGVMNEAELAAAVNEIQKALDENMATITDWTKKICPVISRPVMISDVTGQPLCGPDHFEHRVYEVPCLGPRCMKWVMYQGYDKVTREPKGKPKWGCVDVVRYRS
jgi:hypothetical protein